jgi:hypothetical protein
MSKQGGKYVPCTNADKSVAIRSFFKRKCSRIVATLQANFHTGIQLQPGNLTQPNCFAKLFSVSHCTASCKLMFAQAGALARTSTQVHVRAYACTHTHTHTHMPCRPHPRVELLPLACATATHALPARACRPTSLEARECQSSKLVGSAQAP